jgi:hypothetical protein
MSSGDETVVENVFNDDEVAEDQEEDLLDDESYTALK